MALIIRDPVTEQLAAEVAALTHDTKTNAVRTALLERKERLEAATRHRRRGERLVRFLEDEAWPQIPLDLLGHPISRAEREAILGYGQESV
jgi:antitoxin VapB